MASIEASTVLPGKLLVVDNASPYKASVALSDFSGLRPGWLDVLEMPSNKGFASAFNAGSRKLKELGLDGWVNLSHDVVLSKDTLAGLYAALEQGQSLVGPTIKNLNTGAIFSSGGRINIWSGDISAATQEVIAPVDAHWLDGSCFAISKELFQSVNGMNEGLFLYFEDVDLGIRAVKKGVTPMVLSVIAEQDPKGPSPYLRGHSSGVLASSNMNSPLFFSLIARNVGGSAKEVMKGHFARGISRLRGLFDGLRGRQPAYSDSFESSDVP